MTSQLPRLFLTKSRKSTTSNRFVSTFKNQFEIMKKKQWKKLFVAVDIHDTTMYSTYSNKLSTEYYPFAKETLQLMSQDPQICLILWTCSTKDNCIRYMDKFKNDGIIFSYVNGNPEVVSTDFADFESKLYANVILDDKGSFLPLKDWPKLHAYFLERLQAQ